MPLPKNLKVKGPEVGYCNICRNYGNLTRDHVPPKGCIEIKRLEIRTLAQEFYGNRSKPVISSNGVKFRTLCGKCNNELLGTKYDPELKKFTDQVSLFLRSKIESRIHFPANQTFQVNTQRVVRSIVGHLLAAFLPEDTFKPQPIAPIYDGLRDYFLDESKPIPNELTVYFWLFPVKQQVIIKAFGLSSIGSKGIIVGDIIKFFPMAYWLVWQQPKTVNIHQHQLGVRKDMGIDASEDIRINFSNIPARNFPEAPKGYEFVLFNDQFSISSKVKRKI